MKHLLPLAFVVFALAPTVAFAQDRPVVFVHGLKSGDHSWAATATRLQQQLAIRPYLARLPWTEHYETQTAELQRQFGGLPASTIAVGHSNGGIVSRLWSRQHALGGLVTVGTPNYGAPIVDRVHSIIGFNTGLYNAVGMAAGALGIDPGTWGAVAVFVQSALSFGANLSVATVLGMSASLGIETWIPVVHQMASGSYVLNDLNSSWSIGREQAEIPGRVGLVYVAANYPYAGPMRAIDPDNADRAYTYMWASVYTMDYAAAYLSTNYSSNSTAMWIANSLLNVSGWLRQVDPVWCWAVTGDSSCATWHDGLLPTGSQLLPGAPNVLVAGPAHTQESKEDGPIHYALTAYLGVPSRGGGPPPSEPGGSDELAPGQVLYAGQHRTSGDGRFELSFQGDGNLVLYRMSDGAALWATHTVAPDGQAVMQTDGNLVIYDAAGNALWSTGTYNYPGARLFVQTDGNVVIYDAFGYPIWATGTGQ